MKSNKKFEKEIDMEYLQRIMEKDTEDLTDEEIEIIENIIEKLENC